MTYDDAVDILNKIQYKPYTKLSALHVAEKNGVNIRILEFFPLTKDQSVTPIVQVMYLTYEVLERMTELDLVTQVFKFLKQFEMDKVEMHFRYEDESISMSLLKSRR